MRCAASRATASWRAARARAPACASPARRTCASCTSCGKRWRRSRRGRPRRVGGGGGRGPAQRADSGGGARPAAAAAPHLPRAAPVRPGPEQVGATGFAPPRVPKVAAALALAGLGLVAPLAAAPPARPPNVVIILADDMGWGDLGVFGNPTIRTPRLDRMAAEGQKWTGFYVGESVCTPSRAALLTGRLAIRSGLNPVDDDERVFYPDSTGGLPPPQITIALVLPTPRDPTTAPRH